MSPVKIGFVFVASLLTVSAIAAPTPLEALIDSGTTKLQSGQYPAAVADFANATKLAPKDPRPLYLGAEALEKMGKPKEAESGFRRALQLQPTLNEVRDELGALLVENGRYDEAIVELKKTIELRREPSATAYFNLGKAQLGRKDCKAALAVFAEGTRSLPTDLELWIGRSTAERTCGALPDAKKSALMAVRLAASSADAQANLGLVLAHLDENQAAFDALTLANKLNPNAASLWTLGIVARRLSRWPESIAALQQAIALKPSVDKTVDLGITYAKAGRLPDAEKQFRAALAQSPAAVSPRFHLVQVLCAQKSPQKAQAEAAQLPTEIKNGAKLRELLGNCPR